MPLETRNFEIPNEREFQRRSMLILNQVLQGGFDYITQGGVPPAIVILSEATERGMCNVDNAGVILNTAFERAKKEDPVHAEDIRKIFQNRYPNEYLALIILITRAQTATSLAARKGAKPEGLRGQE
jgi:hypothetical protein